MCSGHSGRGTPSLQVSSLGGSGSIHTSIYHTAQTRLDSEAGTLGAVGGYMTLYAGAMGKTMRIRIHSDTTMSQLKSIVNARINLPDTELDLIYE